MSFAASQCFKNFPTRQVKLVETVTSQLCARGHASLGSCPWLRDAASPRAQSRCHKGRWVRATPRPKGLTSQNGGGPFTWLCTAPDPSKATLAEFQCCTQECPLLPKEPDTMPLLPPPRSCVRPEVLKRSHRATCLEGLAVEPAGRLQLCLPLHGPRPTHAASNKTTLLPAFSFCKRRWFLRRCAVSVSLGQLCLPKRHYAPGLRF